MDAIETRVKLIKSESEGFGQYLDSLAPDNWSHNSACDLWEVRDVVAHLVWVAEFYLDTISRGVNGDASAPEVQIVTITIKYTNWSMKFELTVYPRVK